MSQLHADHPRLSGFATLPILAMTANAMAGDCERRLPRDRINTSRSRSTRRICLKCSCAGSRIAQADPPLHRGRRAADTDRTRGSADGREPMASTRSPDLDAADGLRGTGRTGHVRLSALRARAGRYLRPDPGGPLPRVAARAEREVHPEGRRLEHWRTPAPALRLARWKPRSTEAPSLNWKR
jgi:hypothetical protein